MKIVIDENFFGTCSDCRRTKAEVESGVAWQPRAATRKVYVAFKNPIPARGRFPEVKGIWCYVCDECFASREVAS